MVTMLNCVEEDCICIHHMLLHCLEQGLNVEAKRFIEDLENICQLTEPLGYTFLHYAAKHRNAEMSQHLIEHGCEVNAQDEFGVTPLMLAVVAEDLRTTEVLIKNDADIYLADCDGTSSLELALRSLYKKKVDAPLYQESHFILKTLVDRVDKDFSEGRLTQFLLDANDEFKLAVVVFGNARVAEFVLDNGYPIEFGEPQRNLTALHCAVIMAQFENAKLLIERGAKVTPAWDQAYGRTPLSYYALTMEEADENSEMLKMLLTHATRLSVPDRTGYTEIERILQFRKEKTIKTMLQGDFNVKTCLLRGRSILNLLAKNRNIDNIDFLDELDVELRVNDRDENGETALMVAAQFGYPRKVDFLLGHGADVRSTTFDGGLSALLLVIADHLRDPERESDQAKIVELLLQYGADAQSYFASALYDEDHHSLPIRILVANVAVLGALGQAFVADSTRQAIESNSLLKDYFGLCTRQLDEMKNVKIRGTVTLFTLLTDREDKLIAYVRNRELASAMSEAIENLGAYESYYVNTLQSRVSRVFDIAKLQEKAAPAIETLTRLRADAHRVIVYKIISYLRPHDLYYLCKIESIPR